MCSSNPISNLVETMKGSSSRFKRWSFPWEIGQGFYDEHVFQKNIDDAERLRPGIVL